MIKTSSTHQYFVKIARDYFSLHPEISHDWREIRDIAGGRTDLVCWPDTPHEVFASLTEHQITIGNNNTDQDFESFGRNVSDIDLANEAWKYFEELITKGENDA